MRLQKVVIQKSWTFQMSLSSFKKNRAIENETAIILPMHTIFVYFENGLGKQDAVGFLSNSYAYSFYRTASVV
jgi:hypothetical protein